MTPPSRALLRACVFVALPPLLAMGLAWATGHDATLAAAEAEAARIDLADARAQLAPQDGAAGLDVAPSRLLMQGATIGVSGAAFQSLLTDLAGLSGATLERVDPILAEPAGVLTQMHSRATFSGTDTDLMNLVINIEAAEPLIFVDRLEMTALDDSGVSLRVEVVLSAFAAAEATP